MRVPLALEPDARPRDVLAVGENSMDLVAVVPSHPAPGAKVPIRRFSQVPGGQIASAAAALATLGWRTEYIGRFGADAWGGAGIASLQAAGVQCQRVVRDPEHSSRVAIVLVQDGSGERTVLWHLDEDLALTARDVPDEAIAAARVLLLDDFGDAAVDVARRARGVHTRTVADIDHARPGLDALLVHIDVIIAAQGVPEAITGQPAAGRALAALQADTGAAVVCVTLGSAGSLARANGREIRTPSYQVSVVDTTGAGDLFRAGFIHGWLASNVPADLDHVLRHANAVAALGCQALGARGHLPSADEVAALVRLDR